ncbi:hypothetical protein [Nocardia mangyaensis]|uniref:hypothetical protein n=1 Tax=Nocardia mangyaensis TaxID=2213200 RepID=UPI002675AF03|nr:hypothetical protein [Nocardia mangyaensis]MDO3645920.1 hypothetical protein [Nocardia mangyaensis]
MTSTITAPPPTRATDYTRACTEQVLLPLADNYFRAELHGDLSVLAEVGRRPVIFIGNHAGASLSWDNIVFDALLWRAAAAAGYPTKLQRLVHTTLYQDKVTPFLLPRWWEAMQCHEATMPDFDRLCADKAAIFISPEGVSGLAKGHHRADELLPFSSSFVHMAKRHGALVVPVTVSNSAYLNPFTRTVGWINRLARRLFGLPFLPLGPTLPMILLPRNFIGAMPAQLRYRVHAPIDFSDRGADDIAINRDQAEQLRVYMEREVTRGNDPAAVAMPIARAWRTRWNAPGANPFQYYRTFWEHRLGRPLTRGERVAFSTPVLGYPMIRRRIQRGSLRCAG